MNTAYIGLGANLGDARASLALAVDRLDAHEEIDVTGRSSWYRSAPVGYEQQPDFVNGAVRVSTTLKPLDLLGTLQTLEHDLGRVREGPRFGPRVIDLDLLLYDSIELSGERLELPHPRMHERLFALQPLVEIEPELLIPGRGRAADLAAACAGQIIEKLE